MFHCHWGSFCCLASEIWCSAVCPHLVDLLISYVQVWVECKVAWKLLSMSFAAASTNVVLILTYVSYWN